MELTCAIGSLELDAGVVLESDAKLMLALFRVKVVKATKEPTEVRELGSRLDEILGIEALAEQLLELRGRTRISLEEGLGREVKEVPRLENRLSGEKDAVNVVLRLGGPAGNGSKCGCNCGCNCGRSCLAGELALAVGTTRDV